MNKQKTKKSKGFAKQNQFTYARGLEVIKVCILGEFRLTVLFVIGIVFLDQVIFLEANSTAISKTKQHVI
jgi:hypothetical protein